jgi:hypothetical protein
MLIQTISNIRSPKQFFAAAEACNGKVELITEQGDVLNLKSTLCQYLALTQMFQDGEVEGVSVRVSSDADLAALLPYLVTK